MFYNILKILHIISATLLLTSVVLTFKYWLTSQSLEKIQMQTWIMFIPATLFQLATGFTMISVKQYDLSEFWIKGSIAGFIIVVISWFSFLYLVCNSSLNKKSFYYLLQMALLMISGITLLGMVFFMTNMDF